jgi:hypothetical protein
MGDLFIPDSNLNLKTDESETAEPTVNMSYIYV